MAETVDEHAGAEREALLAENRALRGALDLARHRFEAMRDVGRALTGHLAIHPLLKAIVAKVSELTDCERATLFLVDDVRNELWSVVAEGVEGAEIRMPLGTGIAGSVARTGVGLNLKDVAADARFNQAVDERTGYVTKTLLCMPLLDAEGTPLGVVEALNKRGGTFTVEDERLLEAVGHQMSVALTNAFLFEELREKAGSLEIARGDLARRVSELDLLGALEMALARAPNLEGTLDVIVRRVGELLGADAASVAIVDPVSAGTRFRGAVGVHWDQEVRDFEYPPERGVIGDAIFRRQTTNVVDAREHEKHDIELAERLGLIPGPLLVVPLLVEDKILGALQVMRAPEREAFATSDERFLKLLTARVAVALESAQRRAAAQRDEQLKKIGTMLAGIVHDFKTPMAVIAGYVELMADCTDADERRESAATILRQTDVMVSMTRELLQFSRGESEMLLRKVYLQRFALDIEEMLAVVLRGTGIELVLDVEYKGAIRADETKLKRAVANLAKNAKEAMVVHGGSKLVFGIRLVGDQVELRIEDDGPGVPSEIESRLFESFATHGKADGTGLGLALVKKIVEDHRGEVRFESRPANGCVFRLRLPL